jgi:hypothetical protein
MPLVAGDQIIGAPRVGAFNEQVVARVGCHVEGAQWFDEIGPLPDQVEDLPLNPFADSKFGTCQNVLILLQNHSRDV